ncbi:nitric oxide dioxygenase [Cyclobacterium lianum]|uniref:Flavohemoprotein n=1 Tax=Cyclobacterium lianum TaxID=388280 RepID=A0A1M7KFZ7_9BACT|nr:NO-inducible flavohemoprotein [Cyclobacterium lianum]SHM63761.1 nitric oxide dioxygenase [Cyclobacterium lianum]
MISKKQQQVITATAPALKEHGLALTTHFYKRMFQHHPELKNVFNMGNQKNGKQQQALAMALLAYAEHISRPEVLLPDLHRIGHKHVSLDIRPEHYPIVGNHLLAAIKEVLGDSATADIIDAWEAAYYQLAELMIGLEADMYQKLTNEPGGWTGWRPFQVAKKVEESSEITSFYLYPSDKGKVLPHLPGQFISLKVFLPDPGLNQSRQYSISSIPDENYYRISVKREQGPQPNTNGMISNRLHDFVDVGDIVELTAPSGNFTLNEESKTPLVLISGGVGVTPLISMLQTAIEKDHEQAITWIHGCRSQEVHAFKNKIHEINAEKPNMEQYVFFDQVTAKDRKNGILQGPVALDSLPGNKIPSNAQCYICGPAGFIEKQYQDLKAIGIHENAIFFEEFGPQQLSLN